jgi:hypothetical protein
MHLLPRLRPSSSLSIGVRAETEAAEQQLRVGCGGGARRVGVVVVDAFARRAPEPR